MGCVSQDSYTRKSILHEPGKLGSKRTVKFPFGIGYQIKIRERKCPLRGIIQKCAPHERSPCAPKFGERSHEETFHQERCARKAAWDLARNIYKLKNLDKTTFYTPIEKRDAGTYFNETRGARIRSRFRSINAHDEQKRMKFRRDRHSEKVQNPYCGIDCHW